jgi:hypothetical protein
MEQYINIAPYMNASPYYVGETSPLIKAFTLFQHMTLRHLVGQCVCARERERESMRA